MPTRDFKSLWGKALPILLDFIRGLKPASTFVLRSKVIAFFTVLCQVKTFHLVLTGDAQTDG